MATVHPQVGYPVRRPASTRLRTMLGLAALAEVAVFVLVASQLGTGWTILLALATSALGAALLARQGARALADLRERAQTRQDPARALGDAGLVAVGGLLMVLPGFLGDLLGLLCLLPLTRALPRALIARLLLRRLPDRLRGPVRVQAVRIAPVTGPDEPFRAGPAIRVIEGDVDPTART